MGKRDQINIISCRFYADLINHNSEYILSGEEQERKTPNRELKIMRTRSRLLLNLKRNFRIKRIMTGKIETILEKKKENIL